jgi:hypothetical protein
MPAQASTPLPSRRLIEGFSCSQLVICPPRLRIEIFLRSFSKYFHKCGCGDPVLQAQGTLLRRASQSDHTGLCDPRAISSEGRR